MTREQLAAEFPLGPDSLPQPGVPAGRVEPFATGVSRVYPGAVRDAWLYVPAQYNPAQPACVLIVQDGADHLKPERRWHIPTVLDNLIHRGEIPVTIGIFLNPGEVPSAVPGAAPRENRSFEYDSPGDRYARFLLEEILPAAGRLHALRTDGASRCLMGGSSGAYCAFNAAWERPREFQRVISIVGSYTALRGGHQLAPLVRVCEPKPLRVFLQSGANDLRVFAGDWWTANLEMCAALEYAGYEVQHVWAEHAGHDEFHGSMVFPDALRWAWRDYPRAPVAGASSRQTLLRLLAPGEGWQRLAGGHGAATALAADDHGAVVFADPAQNALWHIPAGGAPARLAAEVPGVTALAAGGGELWFAQAEPRRVSRIDASGRRRVERTGLLATGLERSTDGRVYAAEPVTGRLWLRAVAGEWRPVACGLAAPQGVRLSADQGLLLVSDAAGGAAQACTVQPDGTLVDAAPYFPLHGQATGAIATARTGWSVHATVRGLEVAMRNGVIAGIISPPEGEGVVGVALAGIAGDELIVSTGRHVYRRRIRPEADLWG